MLATAVRLPVAPPAERRLVLVQPAPAVPAEGPGALVCSWTVDPATGTVCTRWSVSAPR